MEAKVVINAGKMSQAQAAWPTFCFSCCTAAAAAAVGTGAVGMRSSAWCVWCEDLRSAWQNPLLSIPLLLSLLLFFTLSLSLFFSSLPLFHLFSLFLPSPPLLSSVLMCVRGLPVQGDGRWLLCPHTHHLGVSCLMSGSESSSVMPCFVSQAGISGAR